MNRLNLISLHTVQESQFVHKSQPEEIMLNTVISLSHRQLMILMIRSNKDTMLIVDPYWELIEVSQSKLITHPQRLILFIIRFKIELANGKIIKTKKINKRCKIPKYTVA